MVFTIYIISSNQTTAEVLVRCLNYSVPISLNHINFENKYFKGSAPVQLVHPDLPLSFSEPFAVILIHEISTLNFIKFNEKLWENAECKILICETETEDITEVCEETGIEVVVDSIQGFEKFVRENSEFLGIGRAKEALECAVAGFMAELNEVKDEGRVINESRVISESQAKENKEDDLEAEMQDFEYFLNKIKENCEKSKTVDDETRRKNAEVAIMELAKYLSLEDED